MSAVQRISRDHLTEFKEKNKFGVTLLTSEQNKVLPVVQGFKDLLYKRNCVYWNDLDKFSSCQVFLFIASYFNFLSLYM